MGFVRHWDARIHLTGRFKVELMSGEDITPKSAKAQAVLALLVTSNNGSRSRSWLQSRLWSDRASEQASGSLRQCLVQLRQSLSRIPGFLETTRQRVSIDPARIEIVAFDDEEILEGLDVRDGEFENWLRAYRERAGRSLPLEVTRPVEPARAARRQKLVSVRWAASGDAQAGHTNWLGQLLSDNVARQLRETFSVQVVVGERPDADENLWHVDIEICQFSAAAVGVRFSLIHAAGGHQIWAGNKTVEMQGAPPTDHPDLALLSNQLIEAAGDALFLADGPDENCPDTLCRYAIRSMFEINPDDVQIADQMFDRAFKIEPRGLYLAWRAQAKTIIKIERHGADEQALHEEAEALCARALELEPNNSMVLATVANTYCLTIRDYERSLFLAGRSTLLNPSNPMAWFALSSASMYAGKSKDALQYTLKANQLALTSPHRFWWDSQVFAAALTSGKLAEAQFFAESCHAQKPDFRPPLRYLIALFSNSGHNDRAIAMADRLTKLEPDFSIERLVKDREYPSALLHKDIGIDLAKVSDLD